MLPPKPTQLYLVSIKFRSEISFVTSFTISNRLKKYYLWGAKKFDPPYSPKSYSVFGHNARRGGAADYHIIILRALYHMGLIYFY